jgi:cyclohexadienyl dehydratase
MPLPRTSCARPRPPLLFFSAALLCAGLTGSALPNRAAADPAALANGPTVGRATRSVPLPLHSPSPADTPRFSDESSLVSRVLDLENERLSLMPAVAAWKWQHHAPVSDPPRERIVILAAGKLGEPLGLAPAPIERLFALQVRLARDAEAERERHWREAGYDFPGRPPDLKDELRPRLDRLTSDLLEALYLAAPAFSRPGFAERYAARAAQILPSEAWSPASRHQLLADLAAIRLLPAPPLRRIEASQVLRIGTPGDYAPFSADSHGRLRGVDIELAQALAQNLGAQAIFVRTSWSALLDDLRDNHFDVAIGGISATPARETAAAASIPYLTGGKTLIARCLDARRFDSLAAVDRPGVRVIVNPGGTNEQYVRAHLHRAQVIAYPSNATIFDQLAAGRADVMITDDVEVELQTRRHPQLCRALPGTLTHAEKVILMPRDPALTAAVNEWLRGELAAGVPARLLREALGG